LYEYPTDSGPGKIEAVVRSAKEWSREADVAAAVCTGIVEIHVSGSESPFI